MPYVTTEAEVWIDLDDFDDEDLIEELERRKLPHRGMGSSLAIIQDMYEHQKLGKNIDSLLRDLYDAALGKIV